jgi:hypothetical protein
MIIDEYLTVVWLPETYINNQPDNINYININYININYNDNINDISDETDSEEDDNFDP